ncbi:MAG: hypothetical protein ACHQD8_01280 [Chitinophagales bacterium]
MKNENENIKNANPENKDEKPKHHTTLMGDIAEEIEHMDTDFPLSGGDESHPAVVHHVHKEEEEEEEHKKTSFFHDLDTDFPLSGGDV